MTLRQLAYWLAVVDSGSFTRAAKEMRVSQPSLSQQIRALEAELGGELIERLPRSVRLTAAGKAFLPYAWTAVRSADRAARAARTALQQELGELEICTVSSIAVGLLPQLIRAWHERGHGRVVRLHEYAHRRLVEEAMRHGVGDIGIGPAPRQWSGPVRTLGWEEFVVVLPPTDQLAGRRTLPLSALASREWVVFSRDHGLNDLVTTACQAAGFEPLRAVETSQVESAARLAAAGIGPAMVPENIVPEGLDAAILRLDPPVGRELTVYARAEWAPLDTAFMEVIADVGWRPIPEGAFVIG
jgi:DNA-binding transcriptional LysR family regulator